MSPTWSLIQTAGDESDDEGAAHAVVAKVRRHSRELVESHVVDAMSNKFAAFCPQF